MKVYSEDKTQELENYDLELGYLVADTRLVSHHEAQAEVQEQSHYKEIATYPNGGKDIKKIIDVAYQPAIEAYDEFEDIQVFIPYTQNQLNEKRIAELKLNLASTDYKAIKYAEGEIAEEEYAETKAQRRAWREEINQLGG